jgi:lipopolysaccharide export system permease protein
LSSLLLPKKAKAQSVRPATPDSGGAQADTAVKKDTIAKQDTGTVRVDTVVAPAATVPTPVVPAQSTQDTTTVYQAALSAAQQQLLAQREVLDGLSVEIHKNFALSFACLVFVLFGPPIALRFPRGGVGVTIGVSIIVFGAYYVCLMGGEALADKGRLPAYVAMWIANVVFSLAGIALLWRVESTTDTSRGGGLRDWWADRKARKLLMKELASKSAAARAASA